MAIDPLDDLAAPVEKPPRPAPASKLDIPALEPELFEPAPPEPTPPEDARLAGLLGFFGKGKPPILPAVKRARALVEVRGEEIAIRAEDLTNPEAFARLVGRVGKMRAEKIEEAARGTLDLRTREQLADMLGMSTTDLLARNIGTAFNTEQIQGALHLMDAANARLDQVNRLYRLGQATKEDLLDTFDLGHGVAAQLLGVAAESGRATASFAGEAAQAAKGRAKELGALGELRARDLIDADRLSDLLVALEPRERQALMGKLTRRGVTMDSLLTVWYEMMLSNPTTWGPAGVNMVSNAVMLAERPVVDLLAAGIGRVLRSEDPIAWTAGGYRAVGNVLATWEGLQGYVRALRTGTSQFGRTKIPEAFAQTSERLEQSGPLGATANVLIAALRPSRHLMGGDEFFKILNARGQVWFEGIQEALAQGEHIRPYLSKWLADIPPEVALRAERFAHLQTLTNPMEGFWMHGSRALNNPVGRLVEPFYRIGANIYRWNLERFPGLSFAHKQWRTEFLAGGARRDVALAKNAVGAGILGTAFLLAQSGKVTGKGPSDPTMARQWREDGWEPESIYVGGTPIGIDRQDILGNLLIWAATAVERSGELNADEWAEYVWSGLTAYGKVFLNDIVIGSVHDAFSALLADKPSDARQWTHWLTGVLRTANPQILQALNRQFDPIIREAHTVGDDLARGLPGFSKGVDPRVNRLGQDVITRRGIPGELAFFLPAKVGAKPEGPEHRVFRELTRLHVFPEPLPKAIFGPADPDLGEPSTVPGLTLTNRKTKMGSLDRTYYYHYQKLAGDGIKLVIPPLGNQALTLREAAVNLVDSDWYKALPEAPKVALEGHEFPQEGPKAHLWRRLFHAYDAAAKWEMLDRFKELKQEFLTKRSILYQLRSGSETRISIQDETQALIDSLRR